MKAPPDAIGNLFFEKDQELSKKFIRDIRQYNNMFAFTSMGGKICHINQGGRGPYTFKISGQNYHNIGSLLPSDGHPPAYSQLYIHDTDNELANRINAVR